MTQPTITMALDQYDAQRDENRRLGVEISRLNDALAAQKLEDPKTSELTKIIRAALEVVGFATANLSPEIVKRWPYLALQTIATNLEYLPDFNSHDKEFALELLKIAAECRQWELKRANSVERYVPPPAPDGAPQAPYGYVTLPTIAGTPGAELPTKHPDDSTPNLEEQRRVIENALPMAVTPSPES